MGFKLLTSVNHEFSGGEKKRAELLQMLLLQPQLAILDETDSGLDIDALRMVGDVVNQMRDAQRAFIVVTHYHRILDPIQPEIVHVMRGGKISKSGDLGLAGDSKERIWLDYMTESAEKYTGHSGFAIWKRMSISTSCALTQLAQSVARLRAKGTASFLESAKTE